MPLERATYHGNVPIDQLPLVVVWVAVGAVVVVARLAVEDCDEVPDVVAPADTDEDEDVPDAEPAVTCVMVVLWPSCQARAPPSESMAVTLSAVAAMRARAARGLRRGRRAPELREEAGENRSSMRRT
jgi:hypothetical protein